MRYFLSLICLVSVTMLYAQDATENTFERPKFILKYTPTALTNIITPGIQFGVEQRLDDNKALLYEASFLNDFGFYESFNNGFSGYRLKAEYRTYKNDLDFGRNKFKGWVLEGKQRFMETEFRYYHPGDDAGWPYSSRINLTQMNSSVSVYYTRGSQWFYKNNFTFEIAGGLGVRVLNSSIFNASGIDTNNLDYVNDGYKLAVGRTIPLPVGFLSMRIGYVLK